MAAINNFMQQTGFYMFGQEGNWKCLIMIAVSFALLYLAIVKGFEPLLLLPIAFGMLCTNLPGADMFHEIRRRTCPLGPLRRSAHHAGIPDRDVGSRRSRCGACPVGSRQHR